MILPCHQQNLARKSTNHTCEDKFLLDFSYFSSLTGLLDFIAESGYLVTEFVCEGEILSFSCFLALFNKFHYLSRDVSGSLCGFFKEFLGIFNKVTAEDFVEFADKSQLCGCVSL